MTAFMNNVSIGGRRPEGWAVTASLVFHVGIVLILLTATVTSTTIKPHHEDIIHVSLASVKSFQKLVPRPIKEVKKPESLRRIVPKQETMYQAPAETAPNPGMVSTEKHPVPQVAHQVATGPASITIAAPAGPETKSGLSMASSPRGPAVAAPAGQPSKGDMTVAVPCYRENKPPEYPAMARLRGYEGMVMLAVEIFSDGSVGSLKIKSSSGYAVLDKTALETVKTWKFVPGRKAGKTVAMWVDVPIKFVLSKN
jgi:periplasmic protein TonB